MFGEFALWKSCGIYDVASTLEARRNSLIVQRVEQMRWGTYRLGETCDERVPTCLRRRVVVLEPPKGSHLMRCPTWLEASGALPIVEDYGRPPGDLARQSGEAAAVTELEGNVTRAHELEGKVINWIGLQREIASIGDLAEELHNQTALAKQAFQNLNERQNQVLNRLVAISKGLSEQSQALIRSVGAGPGSTQGAAIDQELAQRWLVTAGGSLILISCDPREALAMRRDHGVALG